MKIDLFEELAAEYTAGDTPAVVETTPAWYVAAPGQGPPGEGEFDGKLAAVMATAGAVAGEYAAEGRGFGAGKLEAIWWTDSVEGIDFAARPRDEWRWQLMVRVPDFVTAERVAAAAARVAGEQPGVAESIVLERMDEGRCVQMLHLGPYKNVVRAMAAIRRYAAESGLQIAGRHHEICVTDPRHTELADMQTIVRYPVCGGE